MNLSIYHRKHLNWQLNTETFLDLHLLTCSLIERENNVDIFKFSAKTRKMYVDFLKYFIFCRFYFGAIRNYVVIGIAT